ncbi:hypothetical protein BsWGS_24960 [Bradybaena similaris]
MSCINIPCSDANTGKDLICKDENSRRPCFLHSDRILNWSEAHNYCHNRQGWLLNSMDPIPLNASADQITQLAYNKAQQFATDGSIWSGYHIREHRLLADNFPIPNSSGDFGSEWTPLISGECVLMNVRNCKPSPGIPGAIPPPKCRPPKKFSTCDLKAHFICVFEHSFDLSKVTATNRPQIEVKSTSLTLDVLENGEYRFSKPKDFEQSLTTIHNLTVNCIVHAQTGGKLNEHLQAPVIYNFGVPLPTTRANELHFSGYDYWVATVPVVPRVFVNLFRCDVFNPRDGTILQSEPTFVRFSGDVIFSAHVNVTERDLTWEMFTQSLVDRWPGFNRESKSKDLLMDRLRPLNIRPMIFFPDSKIGPAQLVMLVPVSSVGFDTAANDQEMTIIDTRNMIDHLFKDLRANLQELDLSTLILRNVHKCLQTDDLTKQLNTRCSLDNQPINRHPFTCEGDRMVGFQAKLTKVRTKCDCSQATSSIKQLWCVAQSESISAEKLAIIINNFKNMTLSRAEPLVAEKISIFADIFERSSKYITLPDSAVQNCLHVIDAINRSPKAILSQAQEESHAAQKILGGLERIGTQMELKNGHQRFLSKTMAVDVWNLTYGGNVSNTIGLKITKSSMKDLKQENVFPITSEEDDYESVVSSISLQEKYITTLFSKSKRPDIRLIMKAYTNTSLFEVLSQRTRCTQTRSPNETCYRINSGVVSMQLLVDQERQTVLSPHHVTFGFSPLENIPEKHRLKNSLCVYWDFSANQNRGDWSTEGCYYDRTEKGKDVCKCNHLTNFAVIMSFYDQGDLEGEHDVVLGIITIVGLGLSISGMSLSILSFLLIKSLRDGLPQKLMFQLSLSLLLSWIVFLAGFQQTSSHAGCLAVAALLHYLILASFMWMLGQGILQHMLIVQVMKAVSPKFISIYAVIAWGVPVIPVAAVLAIDTELYKGGKNYCWMKPKALYYSFALPVGLIVLTNIFIFIRVIIRLHKRGIVGTHVMQQGNQTLVNVRASIISFFILGLSWTFGFLAVAEARVYFQYLFCILTSIQGFLIFAMMIARNHKFQQYWKSVFTCCFRAKGDVTTDSQKRFVANRRHLLESVSSTGSAKTYRTEIRSDNETSQ